jgi:hypothetical protein
VNEVCFGLRTPDRANRVSGGKAAERGIEDDGI